MLSEKTLACPAGKEVCLILVRDLTALLFSFLQKQPVDLTDYRDSLFNCSGCKGLIKFALLQEDEVKSASGVLEVETSREDAELMKVLAESEIFNSLERKELLTLLPYISRITLDHGSYLLRKGEENQNIYLIESGKLIVEDDDRVIESLHAGEICGEMSYLCGDVAISSVRAESRAIVLAINGMIFGRILGARPEIQGYMAKILAARLRKTAAERSREFASCMSGKIDEIVPAELLQIFHMHQKTGVLHLELPAGKGRVSFREGGVVDALYGQMEGEAAIFEILSEKSGTYSFITGLDLQGMQKGEIADFMMLLMEGVKRADEDSDEIEN